MESTDDARLNAAFARINRGIFLPADERRMVDYDGPLPIGFGQTNSQPTTVRRMLRWLDLHLGQRVLDLGSGSGWTSALIADLIGEKGKVFAVERIPALCQFGQDNCRRAGATNVQFFQAGETLGLPGHAPFDRILVSAAAHGEIPQSLVEQLTGEGKMVIPVDSSVFELLKSEDPALPLQIREHIGYAFVPLIY